MVNCSPSMPSAHHGSSFWGLLPSLATPGPPSVSWSFFSFLLNVRSAGPPTTGSAGTCFANISCSVVFAPAWTVCCVKAGWEPRLSCSLLYFLGSWVERVHSPLLGVPSQLMLHRWGWERSYLKPFLIAAATQSSTQTCRKREFSERIRHLTG